MRSQALWISISVLAISSCRPSVSTPVSVEARPSASEMQAQALKPEAQAQTYTLKIKDNPDVGKSAESREVSQTTSTVKIADTNGKTLVEKAMTLTKDEESTLTVLEKGDKHPNKYKITFKKSIQGEAGKATPAPYQGRPILFERKGDQYAVSSEGAPVLNQKDLEPLISKANDQLGGQLDELILPKKPVKVGESWPVDSKQLAEVFALGGDIDAAQTKAQAKLVKAYQKDGKQFGIIELEMKAAIKNMKEGDQELKFDPPGTFELKVTVDTAIDGSTTDGTLTLTCKRAGTTQTEKNGTKLSMQLSMDMNAKVERSGEK